MNNNTPMTTAERYFRDAQNLVEQLACRWLDEHEYENIEDYKEPLQKHATPLGVTIAAMKKRPFGFTFTADGKTYLLTCTTRQYGYKRIA